MDRPRMDIPPEDRYGSGGGQSYRPGAARERTPPRGDSYRARSPQRRNDDYGSYRGARPRSRTPPRRDDFRRRSPSPGRYRDARAADTYRARPRSPAPTTRREDLPRDDLFRREPARDAGDYRDERGYRDERDYAGDRDRGYGTAASATRSPPPRFRDRSPIPLKRGREPSPVGSRDRRTPPPAKRERLQSPRGRYDDYPSRPQSPPRRRYSPDPRDSRPTPRDESRDFRARSRSPVARNERVIPREADEYRRPPSPSPARYGRPDYIAADENGRDSAATSRRSSPPVHPSRLQHDDTSGRPTPRQSYDARESYGSESRDLRRAASPPARDREYADDHGYGADDRIPPPREPYRADDAPQPRVPPAGPAGYRAPSSSMAPPTGPSAATSTFSRTSAAPPSGPRAGGPPRGDFGTPRGRGGFRGGRGGFEGGRGGFDGPPSFRGGRGGAAPGFGGRGGGPPAGPSFGRNESFDRDAEYSSPVTGPNGLGPPPGPRGSFSNNAPPPQPFRQSSNSTATTYPRTQRFAPNGQPIPDESPRRTDTPTGPPTGPRASRTHPAIADLPKPIEGGQKAEPLVDRTKLDKLQQEAEQLRKIIEEKEAKKRKSMREWERLGRETEAAAFRSQLAEEAVRNASGEAEGAGAF